MPCYKPVNGWYSKIKSPSGKRKVLFKYSDACGDAIQVPCGKCVGCKMTRARMWAVRCMHEAQMHKLNCVITLTYNDKFLPANGSLDKEHFKLFIKRLRGYISYDKRYRKWLRKNYNSSWLGLRYFHCGEYGADLMRPHYHACLFGFDFMDKVLFKDHNGIKLYTSKILSKLWPMGFSLVGELDINSASYIARYVTKKVGGYDADKHYSGKEPEYVTMSRNPGLGAKWFEKFGSDVFPHDFIVLKGGMKVKPSRFYDERFLLTNSEEFNRIKKDRIDAQVSCPDNRPGRLRVREKLQQINLDRKERCYEASNV